jgi:hypothetical protein
VICSAGQPEGQPDPKKPTRCDGILCHSLYSSLLTKHAVTRAIPKRTSRRQILHPNRPISLATTAPAAENVHTANPPLLDPPPLLPRHLFCYRYRHRRRGLRLAPHARRPKEAPIELHRNKLLDCQRQGRCAFWPYRSTQACKHFPQQRGLKRRPRRSGGTSGL